MEKKELKLLRLMSRETKIKARGKYLESPGVYKKVLRQINSLKKEIE